MPTNASVIIAVLLVCLILMGVAAVAYMRFYKRSSNGMALVRVGYGGRRIVMNGEGALCIPILQEVLYVNMNVFSLSYDCTGGQALATRDNSLLDAMIEFSARVTPTTQGVLDAAQSLGSFMFHPEKLKELLEDKCVGILRSAAAEFDGAEAVGNKGLFIQKVRQTAAAILSQNGLELEAVSLARLEHRKK